ncbi:MAG: hypothetical protein HQL12_00885 [Candidatus Omnitrophica bacterium]|nr:hypothetical protein [Candidatus Omnitrophota bacterium]
MAKIEKPINTSLYSFADTALISIYVPEESFDKAVAIIKDFELKNQAEFKQDSKKTDFIMILIAVCVVLLLLWWIKGGLF